MSSGMIEPGHTHIPNAPDVILISRGLVYISALRSEFSITYATEVTNRPADNSGTSG
jgi:hypothetical protein